MKVVPLMIALVLTLTGCDTAEAETLVPGVTPDSPDINFGQIPGGLPAGFYDEAEENVSVAVERYIDVSDEITRSSGQRVVEVLSVTPVPVDKGCHSETLVSGRC